MAQYGTSADDALMRRLRELEDRIRQLETAAPLRNATISDGGQLRVNGVGGNALVLMGRNDTPGSEAPDGHKQMVFLIWRETGEAAFQMSDPEPGIDGFNQFWALFDLAGNRVVGDDANSGQGLARPYIPTPFYNYPAPPSQTTSSGSWTTLQRAAGYIKQHPRIQVGYVVQTAAGTTGEVRLWDETHGEQVGVSHAIGAGVFENRNLGPADLTGAHMDGIDLDIQARVISGPGSIGVQVTTAYGIQS